MGRKLIKTITILATVTLIIVVAKMSMNNHLPDLTCRGELISKAAKVDKGKNNFWKPSSSVFNPNAFAPRNAGGFYIADLNTGILTLDQGILEPLKYPENPDYRLPAAVCESDESLFVADYRNNRIVAIDLTTKRLVRTWTHPQLSDPEGIAADSKGYLYVASYGNGKILKFDQLGNLVNTWNRAGKDDLIHPHGLFVHDDRIYVTELGGEQAGLIYDTRGNLLLKFGHQQPGKLKYPTTIWVHKNTILVADAVDQCIKFFNLEGKYLRSLGGFGVEPGSFYYPYGVAVNKHGEVFVADTHNRRIQVFDWSGKCKWGICRPGEETAPPELAAHYPEELPVKAQLSVSSLADAVTCGDEGQYYFINSQAGTVEIGTKGHSDTSPLITGLVYPWDIEKKGGNFWVMDEPGSLNLYDSNGMSLISIPLTSTGFDPTNALTAWVYRCQDLALGKQDMAVANTLPGNIVLLSHYGEVLNTINWNAGKNRLEPDQDIVPESSQRNMPTGIAYYDDTNIIVCDMFNNLVFLVNVHDGRTALLQTPLAFKHPHAIAVDNRHNRIAISEPSLNRIQIFDTSLNYIGCFSKNTVPLLETPSKLAFDTGGHLIVTVAKGIIHINDLGIPKDKKRSGFKYDGIIPVTCDTLSAEGSRNQPSVFLDMYRQGGDKARAFWTYYISPAGIVEYDFNFSFLNFQVPVAPGYGHYIWPTGVGHYALLTNYNWQNSGLEEDKLAFIRHARWFYENAVVKADKAYWPNNIDLAIENSPNPYVAASSQAAGAAVLLKAASLTANKEEAFLYRQIALKALQVLEDSCDEGGVKAYLSPDNYYYAEYPVISGSQRFDIQPFLWTLVFLTECGSEGKELLEQGLDTFQLVFDHPVKIVNGVRWWGAVYGEKNISAVTSQMIIRFNEAMNHLAD